MQTYSDQITPTVNETFSPQEIPNFFHSMSQYVKICFIYVMCAKYLPTPKYF